MKKFLVTLLTVLAVTALFTLPSFASSHDGLCACGREYATKDTRDHMIFDCLGCGRNYTSCTCETCWCGSSLTRTETASGIAVTTCNDCGLPCEECACRDRVYYRSLLDVEQGLTGTEIPNPDNGILIVLATILPFAGFFATYFTVYRRRSATRTGKNRTSELDRFLDRIDREPEGAKRYDLAKTLEETKRDGDLRISDRDCKILCLRKNELLASATEEDWIRRAAEENLRRNRILNGMGLIGSVETVDRMWDFKEKRFSANRKEISGETVAQSVVKWDTKESAIALFETVTPLNGNENNLLPVGSNTTRYAAMIFEEGSLMNRKTDPSTEEERRTTIERLLPGGNTEHLLNLPRQRGDVCKSLPDLPGEASAKRMGEENRFPGGMTR